jgi:hypothetical protein
MRLVAALADRGKPGGEQALNTRAESRNHEAREIAYWIGSSGVPGASMSPPRGHAPCGT